jgi:hypothetical protein
VKFVEHVGFYQSERDKVHAYSRLAGDRQLPTPLRLFAISQLVQVPRKLQKVAADALEAVARAPDSTVASGAKTALEQLATSKK